MSKASEAFDRIVDVYAEYAHRPGGGEILRAYREGYDALMAAKAVIEAANKQAVTLSIAHAHLCDGELIVALKQWAALSSTTLGADVLAVVEAAKALMLDCTRFRCALWGHKHYDPVGNFVCPKCGKEAMGSQHFSGPEQGTIVALGAALAELNETGGGG